MTNFKISIFHEIPAAAVNNFFPNSGYGYDFKKMNSLEGFETSYSSHRNYFINSFPTHFQLLKNN